MGNLRHCIKNSKIPKTDKESLENYAVKKLENSRIADLYAEFNPRKSEKARLCARMLNFSERRKDGKIIDRKLAGSMYCQMRLCPVCSWRRARKLFARVMQMLGEPEFAEQEFIFLTLTLKNCAADELREQIKLITKAFNGLTNNTKKGAESLFSAYFTGTFRAVEVTYNKKEKTYHPHMHVLASVKPDYFKKSNKRYMSHEKLQKAWKRHCKLDYEPIVGIQKVRGDKHKKVSETAKYTVKTADIANAKVLETLDLALYRQRLTAFTGIFKKVDMRLKQAPELPEMAWQVLEREAPADERGLEIWRALYRWNIGVKTYELVDEERVK